MNSDDKDEKKLRPSTLPFDPAEVMGVRVRPADLARLWQVSKQAVSMYIKKGVISTYPDGSICPNRAMKEYLANTDGSRMRANFMRTVSSEIDDLKAVNQGLASKLEAKHEALQWVLSLLAQQTVWTEELVTKVEEKSDELRAADGEGFADQVQDIFEAAGEHAMAADPAVVLSRLDDELADLWQPAEPQ